MKTENINQLQKLIDSDEKETLLSIYIEDGKLKQEKLSSTFNPFEYKIK